MAFFRGQHDHNLDDKDRITIPSKFRPALADGVVVMEGFENCLEVYTPEGAAKLEERWLSDLHPMGADTRRIRRKLYANSDDAELDSAGRLRIAKKLVAYAGLQPKGACVVIGVGDHLEIWDAAAWNDESDEIEAAAPELSERIAAGGSAPEANG